MFLPLNNDDFIKKLNPYMDSITNDYYEIHSDYMINIIHVPLLTNNSIVTLHPRYFSKLPIDVTDFIED